MRKLLLIILLSISIFGASECKKSDIYYANGILMIEDEKQAEKIWGKKLKELISKYPQLNMYISDSKVAYNMSYGISSDMWELFLQKVDTDPTIDLTWKTFTEIIGRLPYFKIVDYAIKANEVAGQYTMYDTLNKQLVKYKNSLDNNKNIIVLSHSQGNLFTAQAYGSLIVDYGKDMIDKNFHEISIATPGGEAINNGAGVTFDNDIITLVPYRTKKYDYPNPNRRDHIFYTYNALGEIISDRQLEKDIKSIVYHRFNYYLGYTVYEEILDSGDSAEDAVVKKRAVKTDVAKNIILQHLYDNIINASSECNNSEGNSSGGTTEFNYLAECADVEYPDPIPDDLKSSIDDILTSNANSLISDIVCPLIDVAVKAYNLQNGGGLGF